MWTINCEGTELDISTIFAADWSITYESKGKCAVRAKTIEGFDDAGLFQSYDGVAIYRDRNLNAGDYSGGTCVFRGYVAEVKRGNDGGREFIEYSFYDFWWLLEDQPFKQVRKSWSSWVDNDPTKGAVFQTIVGPEVYLGEVLVFDENDYVVDTLRTNGAQIREILEWANECFNETKRGATGGRSDSQDIVVPGTIDPAVVMPITRMQSPACADAIIQSCRWSPDVVFQRNWATTPPTLHVRSRANLSPLSLTITAEQESKIRISPLYNRLLSGVIIYYSRTDIIDGVAYPQCYVEKADANGTALYLNGVKISGAGNPQVTDYTPWVLSHFVQLSGAKVANYRAQVQVAPISNLTAGSAADQAAWWKARDLTLQDPTIDPASIQVQAPSVVDNNNAAINLGYYPSELLPRSSPLYDWMGVYCVEATVKAKVGFKRFANATRTVKSNQTENLEVNHRVILTNAVTKEYSATSSLDSGEAVPTGVADALYQSMATLQYAGTITFVDKTCRNDLYPGRSVTLIGPNHTYPNMVVQRVTMSPCYGITVVEFSPMAALDAAGLIELRRATAARTVWNLPSGRATGTPTPWADVKMSGQVPKENTMHGSQDFRYFSVIAPA